METGLHKPRFKLIHLVALVALCGVIFGTLPAHASTVIVGMVVFVAFMISVTDRISVIEWLVVLAIGVVLFALTLPPVQGHGKRRAKIATPVSPSTPISVP